MRVDDVFYSVLLIKRSSNDPAIRKIEGKVNRRAMNINKVAVVPGGHQKLQILSSLCDRQRMGNVSLSQ